MLLTKFLLGEYKKESRDKDINNLNGLPNFFIIKLHPEQFLKTYD